MNDNNEVYEGEVQQPGLEILSDSSMALSAVERASIDMQITTAKKYPRSVAKSTKEAKDLVRTNEAVAASMFYALPRGGKKIEGPSARLAEVMAYSWGNLRVDADIVGEDQTHITAMGTCFDLEKNVAIRVRVRRRITDKNGTRYNADMIGVTGNAAISIALRNAVFKVIPAALVQEVYQVAREASLGTGTLEQTRDAARGWLRSIEVTDAEAFRSLGVQGWADVNTDQLITLHGFRTAIIDGETTVVEVFRPASTKTSPAGEELRQASAGDDEGGPRVGEGTPGPVPPQRSSEGTGRTPVAAPRAPAPKAPRQAAPAPPPPQAAPEPGDRESGEDEPHLAKGDEAAAKLDPAALDAAIEAMEGELGLKGGTAARRRRRYLGATELADAERASKLEYHGHLRDCLS